MSESFSFDPDAPIESLERAGVAVQRAQTSSSSSFSVNGIDLGGSSTSGVRFTFTLPEPSPLHLVLAEEKFSNKLAKIFKKELQVGVQSFDDAVFITTSDKAVAGSFLANEDVRDIIYPIIVTGGTIAVEGEKVRINIVSGSSPTEDEKAVARLVGHILTFRP